MKVSELNGINSCPALKELFSKYIDMQFDDVRTMLKLPKKGIGLNGGCNLAAGVILLNLTQGIAEKYYTGSQNTGEKFKGLLENYYPWDEEGIGKERADYAKNLYEEVRCAISHRLGLEKTNVLINYKKRTLTEKKIKEIEKSIFNNTKKPSWLEPTVVKENRKYHLCIPSLYWGVGKMIDKFFGVKENAKYAQGKSGEYLNHQRKIRST